MEKQETYKFCIYPGNYPENIRKPFNQSDQWEEIPVSQEETCMKVCNFIWRPNEFLPKQQYLWDQETRQQPSMLRIVNHIENIRDITTKTGLIRSLKKYYRGLIEQSNQLGLPKTEIVNVFDTIPTTFILHSQFKTPDQHRFMKRFSDIDFNQGLSLNENTPPKHCSNNMWLLKPATLNQGRGIEIFQKLKDVQDYLESQGHNNSFWVIQKYIEKPLLFKRRKFDIRIWALITIGNQSNQINLYLYKSGYVRTSSSAYDISDENKYVHLTNNCLQQKGDLYGQHEEGNTVSFEQFQQYLDEEYSEYGVIIEEHIMPRIKDIVIDTYLSVKQDLNPGRRKNCFELLGYDFLIDEDFRLWLLEVNQNPYLGIPNSFIGKLLPQMINNMMNLVVDPYFSNPLTSVDKSHNQFELIHSHDEVVNQRRSYSIDLLYPIKELKQVIGVEKKKEILNQRKAKYVLQQEIRVKLAFKLNKQSEEKTRKQNITNYDSDAYQVANKQASETKRHFHRKAYPSLNESSLLSVEQKLQPLYQTPTSFKRDEKLNSTEVLNKTKYNLATKRTNYEKDLLVQVQLLANTNDMIIPESQFDQLFQQIYSRLSAWELFNQKQIEKALKAIDVIASTKFKPAFRNNSYYQKMIQLACNEQAPINIRVKMIEIVADHCKSLLKKSFILELSDQIYQLGKIIQEPQQQDQSFAQKVYEVLESVISIDKNSGKVHIPGFTKEIKKIRHIAFGKNLLLFFLSLYFKGLFKQQIEEDILNNLTLQDIEYQLALDGILNAELQVVEYLEQKYKKMKDEQYQLLQQEKIQKQKQKLKEELERVQFQEAKELKRKQADESLQKRLDHKKRMIMEEKKKQEKELELHEKELEEKKRLKEEERKRRDIIWKYKQKQFNEIGDLKQFKIYQPILRKQSPPKNISQSISLTKDEIQLNVDNQLRDKRNLSTIRKPNERSSSDVMGRVNDLYVFSSQKFSPRNQQLTGAATDYVDHSIQKENNKEFYVLEQLGKHQSSVKPYRQRMMPEQQETLLKNIYPDHPYIKKKHRHKFKQRKIKVDRPDKASFIMVQNILERKAEGREANRVSIQEQKLPTIENQKAQIITTLTQAEHIKMLDQQSEILGQRSYSLKKNDNGKLVSFQKSDLTPLLPRPQNQKLASLENQNKLKSINNLGSRKSSQEQKFIIISSRQESKTIFEDLGKETNF